MLRRVAPLIFAHFRHFSTWAPNGLQHGCNMVSPQPRRQNGRRGSGAGGSGSQASRGGASSSRSQGGSDFRLERPFGLTKNHAGIRERLGCTGGKAAPADQVRHRSEQNRAPRRLPTMGPPARRACRFPASWEGLQRVQPMYATWRLSADSAGRTRTGHLDQYSCTALPVSATRACQTNGHRLRFCAATGRWSRRCRLSRRDYSLSQFPDFETESCSPPAWRPRSTAPCSRRSAST